MKPIVEIRSKSPLKGTLLMPRTEMKVKMCCAKCEEKAKEEAEEVEGVVSVVPDQLKDKVTVFGPADPHALLKKMKRHLDRHATFWPPGDNDHVPPPRLVEEPARGGDPHARGEKHFEQVLSNGASPGPPPGMRPAEPVKPSNIIPKVTPGPTVEVVTGPKVEVRTGPRVEVRTNRDPREIEQIERGRRESEIGDRRDPREVRQGPPREVVFVPVDARDGRPVDPRDVRVADARDIRGGPDPREYRPRSPRGGDPREYGPRSPRGMPPPEPMLPLTRPPEIRVPDSREYRSREVGDRRGVDSRPYGPKSPRGRMLSALDLSVPVPPREIRVDPRDHYPREVEGMRRPDPRDYRPVDPREVEGMRRPDPRDYRPVDPREVGRPDPRDYRSVDPRNAMDFEFRGGNSRDYTPRSPRGMGEPMRPLSPRGSDHRGYGSEPEPRGGLRPAEPRIFLDVTKDLQREGESHGRDNLYPPRGMGAMDPRLAVDPREMRDDPRDYRPHPRPHVSQYSEFRSTEADPRVYQPKDSYFSDYTPSQSYNPGPLATQSLEDQPVTNPNYLKHII